MGGGESGRAQAGSGSVEMCRVCQERQGQAMVTAMQDTQSN